MKSQSNAIAIQILDKEYMIACPEEEREALMQSAKYLDERMKETRDGGRVLGTERMAVMTALNVIHEFTRDRQAHERNVAETAAAIRTLEGKLASAIPRREPVGAVD